MTLLLFRPRTSGQVDQAMIHAEVGVLRPTSRFRVAPVGLVSAGAGPVKIRRYGTPVRLGAVVRFEAAFRSVASGAPIAPEAVSLTVQSRGRTQTYSTGTGLVTDDTGSYYVDVSADRSSDWSYRWEATGAVEASAEGSFRVR
jgi:hypothetical protein